MKRWCKTKRLALSYGTGVLLLGISVLLGIFWGATRLTPTELWDALQAGDSQSPVLRILVYVRLPRVWGAVICGAALAVSGAVIQGVLRNHLASPGIIGVNAGAGLAVTICAAMGILGGWRLSLFSFLGAFLAVIPISMGAGRRGASRSTVILMGVALNSLLGALSDTVRTVFPDVVGMTNHFRVGDFSAVSYGGLIPATVAICGGILLVLLLTGALDLLALGEETACGLGLRTHAARMMLLLVAALLAGAAVSICGLLSFVGLLIPHGVRRGAGKHACPARHLIPLCALFGGGFVCLCDTLSRVLFAPYEIPVGIIMAFFGAPFFLFILLKGKGGENHA